MCDSTSSHLHPVYYPLKRGEIRLLVLQPAKSQQELLRAEFLYTRLRLNPPYEAVSYTWGDPEVQNSITLCGQLFFVRENLDAALRRLRGHGKDRVLWIDAICINQADLQEKQEQILQMRYIYEMAKGVIVWLGEPSKGGKVAMNWLKQEQYWPGSNYEVLKRSSELGNPLRWHEWHTVYTVAKQRHMDEFIEAHYGEVSELLDRPWWGRIWAIQETVVNPKTMLRCGADEIPFELAVHKIERPNPYRTRAHVAEDPDTPIIYPFPNERALRLSSLRSQWQTKKGPESIYKLLWTFRRFECTDPRDRIYAFLGLANDLGIVDIKPNYSASVSHVYTEFAHTMMKADNNLLILNLTRTFHQKTSSEQKHCVYSLFDQCRFHDTDAEVLDRPDMESRIGWARLPDGWERQVCNGRVLYFNHKYGTSQDLSPLVTDGPLPSQAIEHQRHLPSGWHKKWDNLGRSKIEYGPYQAERPPQTQGLVALPSWVPDWARCCDRDPEPLVAWPDGQTHRYCASAHRDAVYMNNLLVSPQSSILELRGVIFDEIFFLASPWYPKHSQYEYPASRKGHPVIYLWEWLALQNPTTDCPYAARGMSRKEAFWRTLVADYPNELAEPKENEALFEVWCNRPDWTPQEADADNFLTYQERFKRGRSQDLLCGPAYDAFRAITEGPRRGIFSWLPYLKYRAEKFGNTYRNYRETIFRVCKNRALFVSKKGYIGLAPWNATAGDLVCILFGGDTPFLLRRISAPNKFELVGESYVYGIMGGEALQSRGNDTVNDEQTILLV